MNRIRSIDVTRGIVIIIMALDHVRDYLHVHSLTQNPVNLATTSPALFFTRWITHICAPTFVFLAGTSVYLQLQKSGPANTKKFLLKRGLWLIILELTVINFIFWFDPKFRTLIFEVIGTIGFGFIILALLLKLPAKTLGVIGACIILLHGLLPLIPFSEGSVIRTILTPFFGLVSIPVTPQFSFTMTYPPIPWLGVMLVGFAAGDLFKMQAAKRTKLLFSASAALAIGFIIVRSINIYGDPAPWSVQKDNLFTFLSFMNVSKYPPSLLFCMATLSITCLLLAVTEKVENSLAAIASVYGSVPLFYFAVHFLLVHLIMLVMVFLQGYHWKDLIFTNFNLGRPAGKSGLPLAGIYAVWIIVVTAMYPLCKWFANYKRSHREKTWLRYL